MVQVALAKHADTHASKPQNIFLDKKKNTKLENHTIKQKPASIRKCDKLKMLQATFFPLALCGFVSLACRSSLLSLSFGWLFLFFSFCTFCGWYGFGRYRFRRHRCFGLASLRFFNSLFFFGFGGSWAGAATTLSRGSNVTLLFGSRLDVAAVALASFSPGLS